MSIEVLQDASRRIVEAWRRYDEAERELRARYLTAAPGQRVGPADEDAFASQLAGRAGQRDAEITAIRTQASRENASDEAAIRSRLGRDAGRPGDAEISAAWAERVRPRLEAGFPLGEILEAPGLSRADIEGIRRNYPAFITAQVGPNAARAASTLERLDEATRIVGDAELGLLSGDVREAVLQARQRDGAERAMTRVLAYDRTRRDSRAPMPIDAATELELGFGIASDLGVPAHVPGRQDWTTIVAQIDPEANARAARNSLSPNDRAGLDANARDVGFAASPAEPVLNRGS